MEEPLRPSEEIKEELHSSTLLICLWLGRNRSFCFYDPVHTRAPAAHKLAFTVAVLIWRGAVGGWDGGGGGGLNA